MANELKFTDEEIKAAGDCAANYNSEFGYHCSESILRAAWPLLFPKEELTSMVRKIIMPLRGGIAASMSSHCGGLMVGILLIGGLYGRDDIDGDGRLAPAIARRYWQRFLEEYGTSQCSILRGIDAGENERNMNCNLIIRNSTMMLLQFINELSADFPTAEKIYSWGVDRTNEPCHEQISPIKSSDQH